MRFLTTAIIGIALLAVSPAAAETLTDGRALNPASAMGKYLYSMDFFKRMHAVAYQADRTLGVGCDTQYDIKPVNVVVFKPIELPDGAAQATSGLWAYRFDAVRCGTAKRYNMAIAVQPDATLVAHMMLPGDTITSPQLSSDALRIASVEAAARLGRECKELQIFDIALAQGFHTISEGGKSYPGVWKETWTFQGCGTKAPLAITFIPDGKGGTSIAIGK